MYNKNFFDTYIDRSNTNSIKWDKSKNNNLGDIIPMFVADMDFRCPSEIKNEIIKRAEHSIYGYTYFSDEQFNIITTYLKNTFDISLYHNNLTLLPSVVTGLKIAIRSFSKIGDNISILSPVYGQFKKSIDSNNRITYEVPLIKNINNKYYIDYNLLESSLKNGSKILILCNPHNPVSRLWTKDELKNIIKIAQKYNTFIISDEIHADFAYNSNEFNPFFNVALECNFNKYICLYSPTKIFNIAGLQFAIAYSSNDDIINTFNKEKNASGVEPPNIFAQIAATSAFEHGENWKKELILYLNESRNIINTKLSNVVKFSPLDATYLAWLDFSEYSIDCKSLEKIFIENGLLLSRGDDFSLKYGESYMRLNYACPHDTLKVALDKIIKINEILKERYNYEHK